MEDIPRFILLGPQLHDFGLFVLRATVGVFFAISGFNKLFNAGRHQSLKNNLTKNGIPFVGFMCWFVPFWEFVSGVMLTIGLFSMVHVVALIIICLVACGCEAAGKVERYGPINCGDRVADYLYLPEVLYIAMLVTVGFAGVGAYSLDAVLAPVIARWW